MYKVLIRMSIGLNRICKGEQGQTFSARNWDRKRQGKSNLVGFIDYILGKEHCLECWVNWKVKK